MRKNQMRSRVKAMGGFTLIELLIVVAIIAILAAIAVPNFLEAQVRSKVGRIKADARSIATALEAYAVDYNKYPWNMGTSNSNNNRGPLTNFRGLSTPTAYLTSLEILDPFVPKADRAYPDTNAPYTNTQPLKYINIQMRREEKNWSKTETSWAVISYGPDKGRGPFPPIFGSPLIGNYGGTAQLDPKDIDNYISTATYDATNGTTSGGDIIRWSGGRVN